MKNLVIEKGGNIKQENIKQEKEKFTVDSQTKLNPFADQSIENIPKYSDVAGVDRYGKPQTKEDICRDVTTKDSQLKDLEQEDMLEYVTKGDISGNKNSKKGSIDDELDRYFKDNMVSENVADLADKFEKCDSQSDICKFKADNHQLPLSTTCSTKITDLKTDKSLEKRVIADCNLPQDKKNIMILKEYENENSMNGGALYGNLGAYDEFDLNFEKYSCK